MITSTRNNQYFKYSMLSDLEKQIYHKSIYNFIRRLAWEYPGFKHWYDSLFKETKELHPEREILICEKNFTLAGVAILKSDADEQKICTLRVAKRFQRQGIGHELMRQSLEWLQNDRPLITLHKTKQYEFSSLLKYYGFQLDQEQWNYYNIFSTELVYNGILPEKKVFCSKIELLDIQKLHERFVKTGKYDFDKFLEECINRWYFQECQRIKQMIIY